MDASALTDAIKAVCPACDGISASDASGLPPVFKALDGSWWRVGFRPEATDAQKAAAAQVIATWVETRTATGSQIYAAFAAIDATPNGTDQTAAWDTAVAAAKPAYRWYWASHYSDRIPETNGKMVKIAKAAGVDLKALYDVAITQAP